MGNISGNRINDRVKKKMDNNKNIEVCLYIGILIKDGENHYLDL